MRKMPLTMGSGVIAAHTTGDDGYAVLGGTAWGAQTFTVGAVAQPVKRIRYQSNNCWCAFRW